MARRPSPPPLCLSRLTVAPAHFSSSPLLTGRQHCRCAFRSTPLDVPPALHLPLSPPRAANSRTASATHFQKMMYAETPEKNGAARVAGAAQRRCPRQPLPTRQACRHILWLQRVAAALDVPSVPPLAALCILFTTAPAPSPSHPHASRTAVAFSCFHSRPLARTCDRRPPPAPPLYIPPCPPPPYTAVCCRAPHGAAASLRTPLQHALVHTTAAPLTVSSSTSLLLRSTCCVVSGPKHPPNSRLLCLALLPPHTHTHRPSISLGDPEYPPSSAAVVCTFADRVSLHSSLASSTSHEPPATSRLLALVTKSHTLPDHRARRGGRHDAVRAFPCIL